MNIKYSLYKVILIEDSKTSQDFISYILKNVFKKENEEIPYILNFLEKKGKVDVYMGSFEIAKSLVRETHLISIKNNFPLTCSIEKEIHSEQ